MKVKASANFQKISCRIRAESSNCNADFVVVRQLPILKMFSIYLLIQLAIYVMIQSILT